MLSKMFLLQTSVHIELACAFSLHIVYLLHKSKVRQIYIHINKKKLYCNNCLMYKTNQLADLEEEGFLVIVPGHLRTQYSDPDWILTVI